MPVIDVGMTYDEAVEASQFKPMPEGDYEFQVRAVESHQSEKGNTVLRMNLVVVNNPDYPNRVVRDNPTIGFRQMDQFCKATGFSWEGRQLVTEDLVGLTGGMHLIVDSYENKAGETVLTNRVQRYFKV